MPIDKVAPNFAANAYTNSLNVNRIATDGEDDGGSSSGGGPSFSAVLRDTVSDSIQTIKDAEVMSAKAVTGEADITDVVSAVSDAEITLQTVVAIRDRMISAYQEILRMPI